MNYVKALGVMTAFLTVVTALAYDHVWFEVTLGTLSSGIEVSALKRRLKFCVFTGFVGSATILAELLTRSHHGTGNEPNWNVVLW